MDLLKDLDPEVRAIVQEKMDGELYNTLTSLGTPADPIEQTLFTPPDVYYNTLFYDTIIRRSKFADRIVSFMPNKMTQKWGKVTTGKDVDKEVAAKMTLHLRPLRKMYRRGLREAKINGGAAILRLVNDGRDAHEPIDWDNVREVEYSRILNRWEVYPDLSDRGTDPRDPTYYLAASTYALEGNRPLAYRWHKDRVIRFDGVELTEDGYRWSTGWGDSILLGMLEALKQYPAGIAYATRSLKSFEVLHLATDLIESAVTNDDNKEKLRARWATIQACMSVLNMVITSRENEELNYLSRRYSGVSDMLEKARVYLCDVSGMTKAQLFNEHPTGSLNSTGESISKQQALDISERQRNEFEDPLLLDINLLMASRYGPTNGNVYDDVGFEWIPLFELTKEQKAEIRQKDATTISTLMNLTEVFGKPIFMAEEIRGLYAGNEYRDLGEIVLDEDAYEERLEEIEAQKQAESQFEFPEGMEGGAEGVAPEAEGEAPTAEEGEEPPEEGALPIDEVEAEEEEVEAVTPTGEGILPATDSAEYVYVFRVDGEWAVLDFSHMDEGDVCETGLSCGDACIDPKEECRLKGTPEQNAVLGALFGETGKKVATGAAIAGGAGLAAYLGVQVARKRGDIQAQIGLQALKALNAEQAGKLIEALPVNAARKQSLRELRGAAKARAIEAVQTGKYRAHKFATDTKNNVGHFTREGKDGSMNLFSVGSAGDSSFTFGTNQVDTVRTRLGSTPVYEMGFLVDNGYSRKNVPSAQAKQIIRQTKASYRQHLESLPDNAIIRVKAWDQDDAGARRNSLYRRAGFRDLPGVGGDYIWALKNEGQFTKLDDDQAQFVANLIRGEK